MQVNAINNVSSLRFEGKSKRNENKNNLDYPQMDSPASKDSAKAMKNLVYGLMLLGAAAGGGSMMTGCAEAEATAKSVSVVVVGHNCNHDHTVIHDTIHDTDTIIETIIKPVVVKEYPYALGDSLIAQGLNIGIPLDGPKPNSDDVAFVASKAFNRYDRKFYETQLDSVNTNREQLSLITKVVDLYDSKNPTTSWMKTLITDVPGKGIKFERYVSNSEKQPNPYEWNYAGRSEIRSNGARGNKPGVNTVYDNAGNMIWKGEYKKGGEQLGQFLYGQIPVDENGNPYLDEDGKPEMVDYDFDQAKMWSERIQYKEIPNPDFYKLD